jgi:hypothetical protein
LVTTHPVHFEPAVDAPEFNPVGVVLYIIAEDGDAWRIVAGQNS